MKPCNCDQSKELTRINAKLLEACQYVENWWRLPNTDRTVDNIEMPMIKVFDAIEQAEKFNEENG